MLRQRVNRDDGVAKRRPIGGVFFGATLLLANGTSIAQDRAEIARQLANPVASLVSVPIQVNYDRDLGVDDNGSILRTNVQPVLPFSISGGWNLISRTIVPLIELDNVPVSGSSEYGLGDTVQSLFFSPKAPTPGGWIWGVGPVLLLPTATDEALGNEQ